MYPVETPGPMTPAVDPPYKFRLDQLRVMLLWLSGNVCANLYLSGPTGAGKTTLVKQVCARIGKQVFRVGCHKRMEIADMVGRMTLMKDGSMEFVPGAVIQAMEAGGVLLLDEADQLPASTAMGLNPILEFEQLYVPEMGQWVTPQRGFRVAITGNSAGRGDETGLYRGVERQNLAWLDRLMHMRVDYLDPDDEVEIIAKVVPDLPETIARAMATVAQEVRKVFVGVNPEGELETTLSTRTLVQWSALTVALSNASGVDPVMEGLNIALLNSAPTHEADAIRGIWQRVSGTGG